MFRAQFLSPRILILIGIGICALLTSSINAQTDGDEYCQKIANNDKKIVLGCRLFYEENLGADQYSCAKCHKPAMAFTFPDQTASEPVSSRGVRNVPTLYNIALADMLFWDGRANSLREQAEKPILGAEMRNKDKKEVVTRFKDCSDFNLKYRDAFSVNFGDQSVEQDFSNITEAIVAFEHTIVADQFAYEAHPGFKVFKDKGCVLCHVPPAFTDDRFHNLGVPSMTSINREERLKDNGPYCRDDNPEWGELKKIYDPKIYDLGRYCKTGKRQEGDSDIGRFKTPMLWNISKTWPYMHDGMIGMFEDGADDMEKMKNRLTTVVKWFESGGDHPESAEWSAYFKRADSGSQDPSRAFKADPNREIKPLELTPDEKNKLVQFLMALQDNHSDGVHFIESMCNHSP